MSTLSEAGGGYIKYDLINFLDRRNLSFAPIVTHQFTIAEGEAYQIADDSRSGKVVFTWTVD